MGVIITNKQKILKTPYTYLICQLGQIKILGQTDTCPLKKMPFHTEYMAKIRISEFSAQNNFFPIQINMFYDKYVLLFLTNKHVFLHPICMTTNSDGCHVDNF